MNGNLFHRLVERQRAVVSDYNYNGAHSRDRGASSGTRLIGHPSIVRRLHLSRNLRMHTGCVNTVEWDSEGRFLLTGSDDRDVGVWDGERYNLLQRIPTGHHANIFHCKFVPSSNCRKAVSVAGDGAIMLLDIETKACSKVFERMFSMALKIDWSPEHQDVFLATVSNSVMLCDVREPPFAVTRVHHQEESMTSVAFNSFRPWEFAVGADEPAVRIYDLRFPPAQVSVREKAWTARAVKSFAPAPQSIRGVGVSCVTYSRETPDWLLVNTRESDLYLVDSSITPTDAKSPVNEHLQVYKGRANKATFAKDATFLFHDTYVATGSDSGHMYVWETATGRMVRRVMADSCILNCVSPQPHMPVIATSGIDSDVKLWQVGAAYSSLDEVAAFLPAAGSAADEGDLRAKMSRSVPLLSEEDAEIRLGESAGAREEGNRLFREGAFGAAVEQYEAARLKLHFRTASSSELEAQRKDGLLKCLSNLAACKLKMKDFRGTVEACARALEVDADNAKSLFRKAQAHFELREWDEALRDATHAERVSPGDPSIKRLIQDIRTARAEESRLMAQRLRSMFG